MTKTGDDPLRGSSVQVEPRGRPLSGSIDCPPDKSITHRSVMFAAMAAGESTIVNPLLGADCRSTMSVFRALGVDIAIEELRKGGSSGAGTAHAAAAVTVKSGGMDAWRSPVTPVDYGNSGTTARLLTGLFAARPGLFVTAFGDASLSERPMGRVVEPLRKAGAAISGRENGKKLPLAVDGRSLKAISHSVDKATAQVKSALILAALSTPGETIVELPAGSRNHSEIMLQTQGAKLWSETKGGIEKIGITGPFRPSAGRFRVPGDPSSAAFLAALALLAPGGALTIRGVLENPTRTGFFVMAERMGGKLEKRPHAAQERFWEPVVDWHVTCGAPLQAVDMEPELAPTLIDEIPILAVLARFANGKSRFRGLEELRVKESDRLAQTIALITALGAKAEADGDDLIVHGDGAPPPPFKFDPQADHRLAMAAGVGATRAKSACTILDPACVAVSFPGFFDVLNTLG